MLNPFRSLFLTFRELDAEARRLIGNLRACNEGLEHGLGEQEPAELDERPEPAPANGTRKRVGAK